MGIAGDSDSTTETALNCNYNIHLNLDKDCFSLNNFDIDYAEHIQYVIPLFCRCGNVLSGKLGSCKAVCIICDSEYEIIKQEVKQ